MLRHSLYKKFGKKFFQDAGVQTDLNPPAKVVGYQPNPNKPREIIRPVPENFKTFEVDPNTVPSTDQMFSQPDELTKGMQPIELDQPSSFAYEQENYDPSQGMTVRDKGPEEPPGFFQKAWDYTKDNWQDMAT